MWNATTVVAEDITLVIAPAEEGLDRLEEVVIDEETIEVVAAVAADLTRVDVVEEIEEEVKKEETREAMIETETEMSLEATIVTEETTEETNTMIDAEEEEETREMVTIKVDHRPGTRDMTEMIDTIETIDTIGTIDTTEMIGMTETTGMTETIDMTGMIIVREETDPVVQETIETSTIEATQMSVTTTTKMLIT